MGIRVHKVLGYGIAKVKKELNEDYRQAYKLKKEDFIEFISNKIIDFGDDPLKDSFSLKLMKKDLEEKDWSPHNSMFYEDETIVFTIPGQKDLHRHDDLIDYYQENCTPRNKVKKIKWGIYPYMSSYIWKETGERILKDEYYKVHYVVQSLGGICEDYLHQHLEQAGFSSVEDFYSKVGVYIPQQIRTFCEFTNIFKDNKTINYLESMLFTFWR